MVGMNKKKSKKVNLLKDQMFLTKKYVDMNDPIYDSEIEDENCFYTVVNAEEIEYSQKVCDMKNKMFEDVNILSFEEFEKKCDLLIDNFFLSNNIQEFIEDIKSLNVKIYNDYLVLQLIRKSFDKDDESQMNVSCLLNILNITKLITPEQVQRAFEKILLSLDDIKLDCPLCYDIFLKYLRFSILDNIIDKNYIFKLPTAFFDTLGIFNVSEKELRENVLKEKELLMKHTLHEEETGEQKQVPSVKEYYADDKNSNDKNNHNIKDTTKVNGDPNSSINENDNTNNSYHVNSSNNNNNNASTTNNSNNSNNSNTNNNNNNNNNNNYYYYDIYHNNIESADEKKKLKDEIWNDTLLWVLDLNIKKVEDEKKEFKKKSRDFLIDFFNDGDTNEVIEFLSNSNNLFYHEFIRISIIESFSKNNICRKYISYLLDNLCEKYVSKTDIVIAFIRIIGYIDDYEIDFPQAKEMTCKFLLRCIYDDVLYPAFLSDIYKLHIGGVTGMMICNKTQQRINDKRKLNLNNINYIWDEDDTYEKMKLKRKINNTLLEYFYSYIDEEEFYLYVDEFLPLYHDLCNYVVKKIFVLNVDINNNDLNLSYKLVDHLFNKNIISEKNVEGGLREVLNSIKDIMLDIPKYPEDLKKITTHLLTKKYITQQLYDEAQGVITTV